MIVVGLILHLFSTGSLVMPDVQEDVLGEEKRGALKCNVLEMFTVVQCVRSQGGWAVSNHQIHIIEIWLHSYLCKPSGAFLNVCNKVCGLLFKIEFKVVNQSVWWCASGSRASLVQNPQKLIKAWCWAFLCVCSCFGPLIWWCFQFYSKYSTAHALPVMLSWQYLGLPLPNGFCSGMKLPLPSSVYEVWTMTVKNWASFTFLFVPHFCSCNQMEIENENKSDWEVTTSLFCPGSPFLASEDGVLGGVIVLRSCRCSSESDSSQNKQTLLGK